MKNKDAENGQTIKNKFQIFHFSLDLSIGVVLLRQLNSQRDALPRQSRRVLRGGLRVAGFNGPGEVQAQLLCTQGKSRRRSDVTFSGHAVNMETRGGKQRSERENVPVSGREAELHCCAAPVVSFCLPSISIVLIFATVR